MEITPLAWDSSFFGLRIGKVLLISEDDREELIRMKGQLETRYDLIYVFSDKDFSFPSPSIRLVDKKVSYRKMLDGTDAYHTAVKEWLSEETTPELVALALESGLYSRFRLDSRFPAGSFERLYTRWIEQSVSHALATNVFCYFSKDMPIGLVTLDVRKDLGSIGLVAVNRHFQHKHIGSSLLGHVCAYAYQQGVRSMTVPTQYSNRPACSFYEKMGFQPCSIENVWHWWL